MPDLTLGELFTQVMQQIPSSQEVNAKYTKPAGGIPGTDLASGVIPDTSGFLTQHQDISGKADKTDTVLINSLTIGNRVANNLIGSNSVAIGTDTIASQSNAVAIGNTTSATGSSSYAEGWSTQATGLASHAEGYNTSASSAYAHSEGANAIAMGEASHAEGSAIAMNTASHAEGYNTTARGMYSHAEGEGSGAYSSRNYSYYKDLNNREAVTYFSNVPGAYGVASHAEGTKTLSFGNDSHAEGKFTLAKGTQSHTEGYGSYAEKNYSHAEGYNTNTVGEASHAEGHLTLTTHSYAHAEGEYSVASGYAAHAEGIGTIASAYGQHAGGQYNIADSYNSWPTWAASVAYKVGDKIKRTDNSTTTGYICKTAHTSTSTFDSSKWEIDHRMNYAVIIGNGTANNARSNIFTIGWNGSVQEGGATTASGQCSHAEGGGTRATGDSAHAEGSGTNALGGYSHAEGGGTTASGQGSHAEGGGSRAIVDNAHAEGAGTLASGVSSHAEGGGTTASGSTSHAEGSGTTASGSGTHSEGTSTVAEGNYSHAEGLGGSYTDNGVTKKYGAYGTADHVEGYQTLTVNGMPGNHAEGYQTKATGGGAHSEGNITTASGLASHAEGTTTVASGISSHAEGSATTASGKYSHTEGGGTTASADGAHAEGIGTSAVAIASHVGGKMNVEDSYASWAEWVASTSYTVGDKVKITTTVDNETTVKGYICKTANSDAEFTAANWTLDDEYNYVEIIGNGTADNARSNARALDWDGNEHLMGDVYVGCNADSTGGTKLAKITDIPAAVDTSTLAPKANPVFTGSITLGSRKFGSMTGTTSCTIGYNCVANSLYSFACGADARAEGSYSAAIGDGVISQSSNQITLGKYNYYTTGTDNSLMRIGNGETTNNRSNAFTLDWDGTGHFKGDVYVGCNANSTGGSKLATESFVTTRVPAPPVADGTYNLQVSVSSGIATYSWVSTGA